MSKRQGRQTRRAKIQKSSPHSIHRKKPRWVCGEVLRLKALMPHNGCRKIAATFNHIHRSRGESIGKTYVANTLRHNGHLLAQIRRDIRRRKPRSVARNLIWALDLTYLAHSSGQKTVFGVIDHGTRACIALQSLPTKGSIAILRALIDAIEQYGKPKILRTDNEVVFTSMLFRVGLAILGVRHQRTAPFAPWQNGRIERFFGSFKQAWRLREDVAFHLGTDLHLFRLWYNHIRPHNNLDGCPRNGLEPTVAAVAWPAKLLLGVGWHPRRLLLAVGSMTSVASIALRASVRRRSMSAWGIGLFRTR